MTKKLCISGYYGFDNFGDETILKILVENLKRFSDNPEITVFSSNPKKTAENLCVNSIHSFDIKAIIKQLINCDCLISGGGSLLQDKTSAKSLIYYLMILVIAQLFGKKTVIFAQGIGPISNTLLKHLTFQVLKTASFITVRDENSFKLLENIGIKAVKCHDPVWNISVNKQNNKGKIGIQLRGFKTMTDNFIIELAENICKYYQDKEILLLSLQNNFDLPVAKKLYSKLKEINPEIKVRIIENTSNEKVTEDISNLEAIIAMRYHACLIAIKAGVKLLPVNYDIKVETLAKEFNLDYINLTEQFSETFEKFVKNNIVYNEDKIKSLNYDFKLLEEKICVKN